MRPQPGTSFAGYEILAECGKGAYGTVFLGTDALGHRVAIKYMTTTEAGDYEMKGLRNYMSLVNRPPALLQIHHCGFDDGRLFYVMEAADNAAALPGKYLPDTLAERLRRSTRIPAADALALGHALLDGLEVLHNAGMLHRDIKPENIIFVNGIPKLADPGLTRAFNETISIAGTPGYLAPELLNGAKASPATDLYALGKVLYRAVTGNSPERYPEQPTDVPIDELYQACRPLMRLCNSNPALRCQNCREAQEVLPKTIRPHGFLRQFRDRFVLQPVFRRQVVICTVQALVVFILLLAGFFASRSRRAAEAHNAIVVQRLENEEQEHQYAHLLLQLELLEHDAPALDRQLTQLGEQPVSPALDAIRQNLEANALVPTATLLQKYRQNLVELAIRHCPPTSHSLGDFQPSQFGYLSSPLGEFLPDAQRKELISHLKREAKAQAPADSPRFGAPFKTLKLKDFFMAFIPPGYFHSPTTGTTQILEYPYWMLTTEVSSELFKKLTKMSLPRILPNQSAEYFTWNDALLFCRDLNNFLVQSTSFPNGYAIRIPTEREWEFVALDGWKSAAPSPREISPEATNQPSTTGTPNFFGMFHIDDNLAELASPYPEILPEYPGTAVARGADYRSLHTGVDSRIPYLRDQGHRWGIGLRPVLAPTSPDYYTTQWYRGPEIRTAVIDGAIYAGFTTIQANLSWQAARQIAQDCGATLPGIGDLPKLPELYRTLGLVTDYPCHLAIQYQDDAWRDLETDMSCEDSRLKPASDQRNCLEASAIGIIPVKNDMEAPVVLLKWNSQEAFEQRGKTFLQNATTKSFELDGHRLAVCRGKLTPYAIRPFVKFLGLSQPTLDYSQDALQRLLEHFLDEDACALGPICFYHSWEQPDGSSLKFKTNEPEITLLTYHSPLLCVLAAKNGRLVQAGDVATFLVEL